MKDPRPFFKGHRTTLLSAGIVLSAAALFTIFIVRPAAERSSRLQKEIEQFRSQVAQTFPAGTGRAPEELILEKQEEVKQLEGGLPQKEKISEILKILSQRAAELGVTVLAVRPQPSQPYPTGSPLRFEEQLCYAFPIQMEVVSPYRSLGRYLESLTDDFPSVVTVDQLEIRREEETLPDLSVSLVVTTYVFQRE